MSDANRWGIFWMMHWEKSLSFVCWSSIEVFSDVMHSLMLIMRAEKNVTAKTDEPTGCPRRRKPVVSSIGILGAELSVGCGLVNNWAIVLERDVANVGFCCMSSGKADEPLQEVRICVFQGLTKHPSLAPRYLRV
jgi:hypothetical protein